MDTQIADGIPEKLEAFVRSEGQLADDETLDHGEELFAAGYLDSIGVLRLVRFVEATFDVTLTDDDLLSPRFTTVDGLSRIIAEALAR